MSRFLMWAVAVLSAQAGTPVQGTGSVLTSSDIGTEHLIRRPVEVDGRLWLGLYSSGSEWRLAPSAVRWVAGEMFGDSTFALAVDPPEPVLLVADVAGVTSGAALTSTQGESLYEPARRLEIQLAGRAYAIELVAADPTLCDARVVLSDGQASQDLYFPDYDYLSCDEPHFTVEWAGDLDRDGRLDLVVTFSQKYSFYPRRLYLSSAADGGTLVGLAAAFDATAA